MTDDVHIWVACRRGNGPRSAAPESVLCCSVGGYAMLQRRAVVPSDPEMLGGTPVFIGTRVPVKALSDYLEGGHPLCPKT